MAWTAGVPRMLAALDLLELAAAANSLAATALSGTAAGADSYAAQLWNLPCQPG
ncbi:MULTISPECIES: hypothetical protein [Streptomyces]|uniref:Uncharacterized protein n=1 Tax=Streptomyces griseosporeus TaxID=1910 RepID=A0ABV3L1E2_STRGS|nr:hypothetical protein [Streptomyces actuosus]MBM4826602.1 hypothetical protein [Streptomyces actuosus]